VPISERHVLCTSETSETSERGGVRGRARARERYTHTTASAPHSRPSWLQGCSASNRNTTIKQGCPFYFLSFHFFPSPPDATHRIVRELSYAYELSLRRGVVVAPPGSVVHGFTPPRARQRESCASLLSFRRGAFNFECERSVAVASGHLAGDAGKEITGADWQTISCGADKRRCRIFFVGHFL